MMRFHLTKGDSADIGFASTCLIGGVITFHEFKDWLYYVIENLDDVPSYIFDVIDLEEKFDYILKAGKILGFDPAWEASKRELLALDGIGYKRFKNFRTDASSRQNSLDALVENEHVESLFREIFPFIEW